jgi:predicted N-acyltransferase
MLSCFCPNKEDLSPAIHAPNTLIFNEFSIHFYTSIPAILQNTPPQYPDLFLSADYLEALEQAPPKGCRFCYLVFKKKENVVGFMACQVQYFKASDSLNFSNRRDWLLPIKKRLAAWVSYNTLIVGNLMLTGDHSIWFDSANLDFEAQKRLFTEGVNWAKNQLNSSGTRITAVFVKDFTPDSPNHRVVEAQVGFNVFQVEPNFVMTLPQDWLKYEDYLEALSSKYRVRAKRAAKLFGDLEKKEFNIERILAHQSAIYALYRSVCDNSDFNLVHLHPNYFGQMKRQLEDKFRLFGYFKQGKLVGFYTTIENGQSLEAHFLGYDAAENPNHQLYLNMLFDIIRLGIEIGVQKIVFARTAPEIKSSVGAVAEELSLFLRHENPLFNRLLPYALPILSPREKWLARQPFR